jgi:hypothetical protein
MRIYERDKGGGEIGKRVLRMCAYAAGYMGQGLRTMPEGISVFSWMEVRAREIPVYTPEKCSEAVRKSTREGMVWFKIRHLDYGHYHCPPKSGYEGGHASGKVTDSIEQGWGVQAGV